MSRAHFRNSAGVSPSPSAVEHSTLVRGMRTDCCELMAHDLVAGSLLVVPARKTMSLVPILHRSRALPVSATNCCHHCSVRGGDGFLTAGGAAVAGAAAK